MAIHRHAHINTFHDKLRPFNELQAFVHNPTRTFTMLQVRKPRRRTSYQCFDDE